MDLLLAIKVESLEKIKDIVNKQKIPHDSKWIDYKILNVALDYGRKDVAMFLLDQNCRVNKTKKSPAKESTPLHNAIKLRDVQIINKLLEKDASILAVDSDKNTPLHLAFIIWQPTIVNLLLVKIQETSNHINLKNNQGLSHLHIACTANNGQAIQGFLDAGANLTDAVDEKSPYCAGFTALHFAVNYKCLDAVNMLLKLDVNDKSKASNGKTPLEIAQQNVEDWLIIIDLLKKKSLGYQYGYFLSNFDVACLKESKKVVEKFIKHGADVNSTTYLAGIGSSFSPLHLAVVSRSKEKVKVLLEHGSKVEKVNTEGITPLHLALYKADLDRGTNEITNLLYASVEEKMINRTDNYGMSYFHIAIACNDMVTVKYYLDEKKADVNKKILPNSYGLVKDSPITLAQTYKNLKMVELLIECGADINDNENGTPLLWAFRNGEVDFIDLFLKNDARVDLAHPKNKWTPLHMLIKHCIFYEEGDDGLYKNENAVLLYIEHLIKLGVDVNAKDGEGDTALHYIDCTEDAHVSYFQLMLELGADINVKNDLGILPFESHCNETEHDLKSCHVFQVYYHHLQKLKALGLNVDPWHEEICEKITKEGGFEEGELAKKEQERLDEITKLKSIKLGEATTLYDFLKLDSRRAALFAQCKTLKKMAMDCDLKEKYPWYGYLIKLQYHVAVKSHKGKNSQSL